VCEQAALADPEVAGQALKRDRLEPIGRGQARGMAQDRLPRSFAAQQAAVGCHGSPHSRHSPNISTTGRFNLTLYDRSCYLLGAEFLVGVGWR